ncbi:MAG: hypothetical protein NVSMB70_21030 [Chamaesiphon sp.]
MSHFSRIKTQITIKEALAKGLERLGLVVEVYDQPTELINTWGDRATAEVIVRRQNLSKDSQECRSDLGFTRDKANDPYQVLFDSSYEFHNSILSERFGNYSNFLAQLQVAYEIESLHVLYPSSQYNISEAVIGANGGYTFEITQKVDPYALQVTY